jgi:adenine deaminase
LGGEEGLKMGMKELVQVASGRRPADLLLKGARILNVFSREVAKGSVAVYRDRLVGIGDYDARATIDLKGAYLAPGLIDGHIHIESTMLTPREFAMAVAPRGTTAVVSDPHEIANVAGKRGIRYILDSSRNLPIDIFVMLPSCVPATSPARGLETSAHSLTARDLKPFLKDKNVLGLAEIMDYPGVVKADADILRKIEALGRSRPGTFVIDGHCPALDGKALNAYLTTGIASDHECTTIKEAREKFRAGMFIMIREGTTERNLKALLPLVTPHNSRRFMFVSDDIHPLDLESGHLDSILRKAVRYGLDPVTALRLVTLNPAEYFGLKGYGGIAPGFHADMVVFKDLKGFDVVMTFKNGKLVTSDGRVKRGSVPKGPGFGDDSVNIGWRKMKGLKVKAEGTRIKVIKIMADEVLTKSLTLKARIKDGLVVPDVRRDILKALVVERHRGTGRMGIGFVRGFCLKQGALASTVAHDSHNIVAIGVTDEDILTALKAVERMKGGLVAVKGGKVLATLRLPVAGLISRRPLHVVSASARTLTKAAGGLGCTLPNPFMTMSFLALPVMPEMRLTDRGLVDVPKFSVVSLFE